MASSVVARTLLRRAGSSATSCLPCLAAVAAPEAVATAARAGEAMYSTSTKVITNTRASTHTEKWMQGPGKSPQELIAEAPPIENDGRIALCSGGVGIQLGHPMEYINLDGTTEAKPATCKYCGLRYYLGHH